MWRGLALGLPSRESLGGVQGVRYTMEMVRTGGFLRLGNRLGAPGRARDRDSGSRSQRLGSQEREAG